MFVPVRKDPKSLTNARGGEGNRPFSAGAGATVLVTSTVVAPYVLRRLKEAVPDAAATLDWHGWPGNAKEPKQMLLFEAFVSKRNGTRHFEDAELAAEKLYEDLRRKKDVKIICYSE